MNKYQIFIVFLLLIFSLNLMSLDKTIKSIGVVSPEVSLVLKDKQNFYNYRINFYSGLTRCYPDDLLSEFEKNELDSMIVVSIENIKTKLSPDIQYIDESTQKNDELLKYKTNEKELLEFFIDPINYKVVNEDQLRQYKEIDSLRMIEFRKEGITTVNRLTDKKIIDFAGNSFAYSKINQNMLDNSVYKNLFYNKKNPIPFSYQIENTNYFYVPEKYTKFNDLNISDYKEICKIMNVDAVLKVKYSFLLHKSYPWNPFESCLVFSISLIGQIEIINNKGVSVYFNKITGKSDKIKIPYNEIPTPQNSFIIATQNDQVIVSKQSNTGRYNFTFDNTFKEMFLDSIRKFKIKSKNFRL